MKMVEIQLIDAIVYSDFRFSNILQNMNSKM